MQNYLRAVLKNLLDPDKGWGILMLFTCGASCFFTMMTAQMIIQHKIYELQDQAIAASRKTDSVEYELNQCMEKLNERANTTTTR